MLVGWSSPSDGITSERETHGKSRGQSGNSERQGESCSPLLAVLGSRAAVIAAISGRWTGRDGRAGELRGKGVLDGQKGGRREAGSLAQSERQPLKGLGAHSSHYHRDDDDAPMIVSCRISLQSLVWICVPR